jgi:hypothetical protein
VADDIPLIIQQLDACPDCRRKDAEIERLRIYGDALAAWVGIHLQMPRRNGKKSMREALTAWEEVRRG